MLIKTSFAELEKRNQKPYVLFGRSKLAEKTIKRLGDQVAFLVDNSTPLQGSTFHGLEVKAPSVLTDDYFVLICSTDVMNISAQLEGLGLAADRDFALSPLANDLLAIAELEELKTEFYFTSGTVAAENGPWGGGLYLCTVDQTQVSFERLYSGPCYGAMHDGDDILFVNGDIGLFRYSKGEVTQLASLPEGARAHGVSYNEDNGCYYINCSNRDSVIELNAEFEQTRELFFSEKFVQSGDAQHHTNDNVALGNSLYVSMFSSSGNWKKDVFDGCVAEFDLVSGERRRDVVTGLYMPHNVRFIDGGLHVLDSLPGHLRYNNMSIQATFPAFTRGLDYRKGLYFIGQSKNRNYSRVIGLSNNISIDCGVIVYNPELGVSRFLQFPYEIGDIHTVLIKSL